MSVDNLNDYISIIKAIPRISDEEEKRLIKEISKGSQSAKKRLVEGNLWFVLWACEKLNVAYEHRLDALQQGTIGLIKAAEKVKSVFDNTFRSFAIHYINAEIKDYYFKHQFGVVTLPDSKGLRKAIYGYKKHFTVSNPDNLSFTEATEIASNLNIPVEDIIDVHNTFKHNYVYLDDFENTVDVCSENNEIETLEDYEHENYTLRRVSDVIESLDARSRDIIVSRTLSTEPKTLEYHSKKYGVSRERIRQIEENAYRKIKKTLGEQHVV